MSRRLKEVREELTRMNIRVDAHRRELTGPMKSFTPSTTAVKFMLTKK